MARLAFADALKQELADACKTTVSFIEANKEVFRLGLQWWGTEWRRNVSGKNYWIDRVREKYERLADPPGVPELVIITDTRFPNELELVHALGGKVWRVQRKGVDGGDAHVSERALDGHHADRILRNDSDLPAFHRLVVEAYKEDFSHD